MSWRTCAVCTKPASFTCGGCKLVNYCGKDHQKQDWKVAHKTACKSAFLLVENSTYGRHLVAARNISQGELIFQEPPFVKGPKALASPVCLGCHSIIGEKKWECDGCGYPLCSVECQVADAHFDECQLMMKNKYRVSIEDLNSPNPIHFGPIVPLRILLMKEKTPDKYKKIFNMESHLKERLKTPLYVAYKQNMAAFIRGRLHLAEFDEDTILTAAAILDTNAFDVRARGRTLRALYGTACYMAHDCVPNVRHTFHGPEDTIAVCATVDIPKGAPICTTYTHLFWGTLARRKHLYEAKYFRCACKRCSDPTELGTYLGAFRCSKCANKDNFADGPKMVSSCTSNDDAPWQCESCKHSVPAKLVKTGNDNLKMEISRLDKSTPLALEQFLSKYGGDSLGILHPKNSFVVQVKHALIQMYGNRPALAYADLPQATLEKKILYCNDLLEVADIVNPGCSRIRGEILQELQASMVMLTKLLFNEGKVTNQATQAALQESMSLVTQVVEIMRTEPDFQDVKNRLETFMTELDQ